MDEFTKTLADAILAFDKFNEYRCPCHRWCPGSDTCSEDACKATVLYSEWMRLYELALSAIQEQSVCTQAE